MIGLIVTDDGNDNEDYGYSSDDKGEEAGGNDNNFCPTTDHRHPFLAAITTKVVSTSRTSMVYQSRTVLTLDVFFGRAAGDDI